MAKMAKFCFSPFSNGQKIEFLEKKKKNLAKMAKNSAKRRKNGEKWPILQNNFFEFWPKWPIFAFRHFQTAQKWQKFEFFEKKIYFA